MLEISILETTENPLLKRKEISFMIDEDSPPDRIEVKEKLAAMHNADFDHVFVRKITTRFGKRAVTGLAMIYEDEESTKNEPNYVKLRNMKKEERDALKKEEKKPKKKKKGRRKK
ncbi:30S ribosomal protein S24e [Candidatus Bathyarchaeota archaeon]|nr:30S ribosomal protein S24e [Candidatus Bathyarchaeota archaeon]